MRRYVACLFLAAFVAGCGGHGDKTKNPEVAKQKAVAAEYEVLGSLLNTLATEDVEMLVVADHTATFEHADNLAALKSKLDVPQEVIDDFLANNRESKALERRFLLNVDYVLMSAEEWDGIMKTPGHKGWDVFYKKYPNSAGHIEISRPGFNKKKNVALVYIGNQRHWLAGTGYYVVLEFEGDRWHVMHREMVWIS